MRGVVVVLVAAACNRSGSAKHDAAIAVTSDARPAPNDAPAAAPIDAAPPMSPHPEEVAVPAGGGIGAFYLDRLEATGADYAACVAAKACAPTARGQERTPKIAMGGLTFYQARAYCAWRGKRLPTPAEWKRAAYGDDRRAFPWGDDPLTCEHAWYTSCGKTATAPGERPQATSAFGALDMLGNVAEWTDPGPEYFVTACVDRPRTEVPVLGGSVVTPRDGSDFVRDRMASFGMTLWVDNPELGVRCARTDAPPPGPPPTTDPILRATDTAGRMWVVEAAKTSSTAFTTVTERCRHAEQTTVAPGDILGGEQGWFVVVGTGSTPPGTGQKLVPAPTGLVRVVGVASCGTLRDLTPLTIAIGAKRLRIDLPTDVYQVWLPPGASARFSTDCQPKVTTKGECSLGTSFASPVTFHVPAGPTSGVVGPILQSDGGWVCD